MSELRILRTLSSTIACLLLLAVAGCAAGDGDDDDDDIASEQPVPESPSSSVFSVGAETADDGTATAEFTVPEGTNKLSVTAESGAAFMRLERIENEDGNAYLTLGGEETSLATLYQNRLSTAQVPARDFDLPLTEGRLQVTARAAQTSNGSSPATDEEVTFTITAKGDTDLRNGTLVANVFLVGPEALANRDAVETAMERMASIYGDEAGIALDVQYRELPGPAEVPFPFEGSSVFEAASASVQSPALNLFVGSDIDLNIPTGTVLGVAASIPGPAHPTAKSAVAISINGNAGPDGEFSEDELRVFGETFAHESGHYLGLFHPIEIDSLIGFIATGEDSLPDTPTCDTLFDCREMGVVSNLMFPTPVPEENGGRTIPQDRLTSQQRGVLNLSAIVE